MKCPICNLDCSFNNGNTYTCESVDHFYQNTPPMMKTIRFKNVFMLSVAILKKTMVTYNEETLTLKSIDINKFLSCNSQQDIDNWFFNLKKEIVFS